MPLLRIERYFCLVGSRFLGTIADKKNAGGVCSYAMLFYNGCTVVVNEYTGSEITADVSRMRLAYNSTSSVTLVQQ